MERDVLEWNLLSSHGNVVFFLAVCPDSTVQEIARALNRTERAIARTLSALRRSGVIRARTVNRRKLFSVNMDAAVYHPTLEGYTLRQLFGNLKEEVRRREIDLCETGLPR